MRKILFVTALAVAAQLLSACNADLRSNAYNTDITFTIEAFHQTSLDTLAPVTDVVAIIPGYAPWLVGQDVPLPYRFTIKSSEYTQAQYDVQITAKLVDVNPDVVLRCTWAAQTAAGRKLSRDSSGGEGESHAGAPVTCHYTA